MRKLQIYLCRHGESTFNVEGRLGGDPPLTQKGIRQAEEIALFLQDKHIQIAYHSLLERAKQTAAIISHYLQETDFIKVPDLAEIRYGSLDSLTIQDVRERFPNEVAQRRHNKWKWKLLDGENYEEAAQRITPFLEDICRKEGAYAIIGHKAINRLILCKSVHPSEVDKILKRDISPESVFRITYTTGDLFDIDELSLS